MFSLHFWFEIFCNGIASGNLDVYMMVNKYLIPDLVLGKGPIHFIIMQTDGFFEN